MDDNDDDNDDDDNDDDLHCLASPADDPSQISCASGGCGGVGGGKGCLARSALVQHRGQPGNRFLPPLPTHSSATLLICSSSRAMPPMYLLESTIGEQLELLPVHRLINNQVFPTSAKSANLIITLCLAKYELQTMRLAG